MGRKRKPTPEKYCDYCEIKLERKRFPNGDLECLLRFGKRKYCDRLCMARSFDLRHLPESQVGWSTCHSRAREIVKKGSCCKCGVMNAKDVHHKDGDWRNNSANNLERICRSCHNLVHKRKKLCRICGKPQKGFRLCVKHYQRFKKYGDPLLTKDNQHTPIRKEVQG